MAPATRLKSRSKQSRQGLESVHRFYLADALRYYCWGWSLTLCERSAVAMALSYTTHLGIVRRLKSKGRCGRTKIKIWLFIWPVFALCTPETGFDTLPAVRAYIVFGILWVVQAARRRGRGPDR